MDKRQKESSFVNQEQLIHFQLYVTGFLEIKCNWFKNKAKILKMPEEVRVRDDNGNEMYNPNKSFLRVSVEIPRITCKKFSK